jgi:hypothetical protein
MRKETLKQHFHAQLRLSDVSISHLLNARRTTVISPAALPAPEAAL